jgi:alanyl-tRNA synthetase
VDVPGFSTELCGGTHVNRTGDIGLFKITSESSVAAGVRRIEGITGEGSLEKVSREETALKDIAHLLKSSDVELKPKVQSLLDEIKAKDREITALKSKLAGGLVDEALAQKKVIKGVPVVVFRADQDSDSLRELADKLKGKLGSGVVVLGSGTPNFVGFVAGVTKDLISKIKAGDLVKEVAKVAGGGGGGRPDFAQAGGKDASKVDEALRQVTQILEKMIP